VNAPLRPLRCRVSWCTRHAVARVNGWWLCPWHVHLICETFGVDVHVEHVN